MEQNKDSIFMENIRSTCKQFDGKPVVCFVRGKVGSGLQKRTALIMLVGPVLTLENLKELRKDITEVLDAKEAQLKGEPLDGTGVIYY